MSVFFLSIALPVSSSRLIVHVHGNGTGGKHTTALQLHMPELHTMTVTTVIIALTKIPATETATDT